MSDYLIDRLSPEQKKHAYRVAELDYARSSKGGPLLALLWLLYSDNHGDGSKINRGVFNRMRMEYEKDSATMDAIITEYLSTNIDTHEHIH